MKKPKNEPLLIEWQRQQKVNWLADVEARIKKYEPPAGWSVQQRLFIDGAVKKIKFTPVDGGCLARDVSALTQAEAFAIGETGTPDWPFLPLTVQETLRASGWNGTRGYLADPNARASIEIERRKIVLDDKEMKELSAAIHGYHLQKAGTNKKKDLAGQRAELIRREAIAFCGMNTARRITKVWAAEKIASKLKSDDPNREIEVDTVRKKLTVLFPGKSWPPKSE